MKVLIANKSHQTRNELFTALEKIPEISIVGQAQDAVQTLELIKQTKPAVIILDTNLPKGGAVAVLRALKFKYIGAFIVVVSDYSSAQYERLFQGFGATHFFDKNNGFKCKIVELLEQRIEETHRIKNSINSRLSRNEGWIT